MVGNHSWRRRMTSWADPRPKRVDLRRGTADPVTMPDVLTVDPMRPKLMSSGSLPSIQVDVCVHSSGASEGTSLQRRGFGAALVRGSQSRKAPRVRSPQPTQHNSSSPEAFSRAQLHTDAQRLQSRRRSLPHMPVPKRTPNPSPHKLYLL